MSFYYLDTSALVKRYFPEKGSVWVTNLTNPQSGNTVIISEATLVEVAAAIAAKQRASGGISHKQRDAIRNLFLGHCAHEYQLVPMTRLIIDHAVRLTQNHRLRGYDAMQLATALTVNTQYVAANLPTLIFVTADNDLLAAAQSEGLRADNPNNYL